MIVVCVCQEERGLGKRSVIEMIEREGTIEATLLLTPKDTGFDRSSLMNRSSIAMIISVYKSNRSK
jgi:hypothetical protein